MRTVAWVNGLGRLTKPDLYALAHAADRIGTHVSNLATVEGFEGDFGPATLNRAGSGARGVIQFMPKTMCALLGLPYTPETRKLADARFARMTFIEQQEYVVKYFAWYPGKDFTELESLYCAIFYPAAIMKPNDWVIALKGTETYRQNAGFDLQGNKDGKITRAEVCAAIRRYRATGDERPEIEIVEPESVSYLTENTKAEIMSLVFNTSQQATEDFRRGSPLPEDVHLVDDVAA